MIEDRANIPWEESVFESINPPEETAPYPSLPSTFTTSGAYPWTPPSSAPTMNPASLIESLRKFDKIVERFSAIQQKQARYYIEEASRPSVIRAVLEAYIEAHAEP